MNVAISPSFTSFFTLWGVLYPSTFPKVTVYVPAGTFFTVYSLPDPLKVFGPVIVKVASSRFVVTTIADKIIAAF